MLLGLHHVTAICSDAQKNVDFFVGTLGQKLVKVTVNFDDPNSYHLYYADATGSPGTLMTYFVWPGGRRGRVGPSQVTSTAYAAPLASLDYWQNRLLEAGIACDERVVRFGEARLKFADPDGMPVEIVGVDGALPPPISDGTVPAEHSLRGFHSVTLSEFDVARVGPTLTKPMGFVQSKTEGELTRFTLGQGGVGKIVDVANVPEMRAGHMGAGVVHHVAFRIADAVSEAEYRKTLVGEGLAVSPQTERNYFKSLYFREPGGVLFEIATDPPGMGIDEEQLGTTLRLPAWYEQHRADIVAGLPRFTVPGSGIVFPR